MSSVPSFPFARPASLEPPPDYAHLRETARAARVTTPAQGGAGSRDDQPRHRPAWLLTGYPEIKAVLADDRFYLPVAEAVVDDPSLQQNPPRHTRLRRLAEKAFTPERVTAMRARIVGFADELIEKMTARQAPVDLIRALAQPLSIATYAELYGVPDSEVDTLRGIADEVIGFTGQGSQDGPVNWLSLNAFISGLIETRNRRPGDDLITALTKAYDGAGDRLTQAELVSMGVTLIVNGYPKLVHTIGIGTVRLLGEGDLSGLVGEPELVSRAVDEILRMQPGATMEGLPRLSTQHVSIEGVDIAAGELLILPLEAANRDPEVFPDPDRFDPSRPAVEHLTFGYGPHRCLGEQLARLLLQVVFEQLAARVPKLRLAVPADQIAWRPVGIRQGPERIDVEW